MHFPGKKASEDVKETGAPSTLVSMSAMPPTSSQEDASDGGGVGRPLSVIAALLLSAILSDALAVMSAGSSSRWDLRTRIRTNGASASAVFRRSTSARVKVILRGSMRLGMSAKSTTLTDGGSSGSSCSFNEPTFSSTTVVEAVVSKPSDGEIGGLGCGLDRKA